MFYKQVFRERKKISYILLLCVYSSILFFAPRQMHVLMQEAKMSGFHTSDGFQCRCLSDRIDDKT